MTSPSTLFESSIPDLALIGRGKVRDIYSVDDAHLLIVTTDRLYQWCIGTDFGKRGRIISRRIAPYHVIAYDFGIKRNILRLLSDLDCRMTVVPIHH